MRRQRRRRRRRRTALIKSNNPHLAGGEILETKIQSEALRLILDYLVLVVFASIPSHISCGCFSSFADGVNPVALSSHT